MPRASKRRSGLDEFVHRAVFIVIAVFVVLYLIAIFVTGQPVIALALMALIVVVPIGLMVRKRSLRKRQARLHVQQAQHLGQVLTVSGAEFEEIAVDLFRALGYRNVERIGRSGDLERVAKPPRPSSDGDAREAESASRRTIAAGLVRLEASAGGF